MGHAHVTHENRLFMKDPLSQIKENDLAYGISLINKSQSVVAKAPSI